MSEGKTSVQRDQWSTRSIMLISGTAVSLVVGFLLTDPIPQDPAYHMFADSRELLGINNFFNVMSALPFLVIGVIGLVQVHRHTGSMRIDGLKSAYLMFFAGVFLTAFGSSYYHLAPDNESLAWDRLPMTIGFAGLFAIIIGEYISIPAARRILLPLVLAGTASVAFWVVTEADGNGDLRPYAVIQFLPMLLIPVILMIFRSSTGSGRYYWTMIAFYVVAKLFEHFDATLFASRLAVSGHTLKHLAAAMAPAVMSYALYRRRRGEITLWR